MLDIEVSELLALEEHLLEFTLLQVKEVHFFGEESSPVL